MAEDLMRNIQWFPGHMTKTRRMIAANLSLVDAVVEILDARIPQSSRKLVQGKGRAPPGAFPVAPGVQGDHPVF